MRLNTIFLFFIIVFFGLSLEKTNKKITYIFGHKSPDTDTITAAIVMADYERRIGNKNLIIPCRTGEINKETEYVLNYFGLKKPKLITKASEADEVILVDHNSPTQSPDDIKDSNVVKLLDHHALTGFEKNEPIFILTEPVGSVNTVLYELYKQSNMQIPKNLAGLMMSAIISDTLLLKSSTTTDKDREAIKELSSITKIDYEDFGMKILIAGTDVSEYTEEELINLDSKNYEVNGYSIQIACLNAVDFSPIISRKEKLLEEMNKYIKENNLSLFVLSTIDILNLNSDVIVTGELSQVVENAFNVKLENNEALLEGVSSRKKELYPKIAAEIEKLPPI